jgi:hypothetical protein
MYLLCEALQSRHFTNIPKPRLLRPRRAGVVYDGASGAWLTRFSSRQSEDKWNAFARPKVALGHGRRVYGAGLPQLGVGRPACK